jgi:hypothetical protein
MCQLRKTWARLLYTETGAQPLPVKRRLPAPPYLYPHRQYQRWFGAGEGCVTSVNPDPACSVPAHLSKEAIRSLGAGLQVFRACNLHFFYTIQWYCGHRVEPVGLE